MSKQVKKSNLKSCLILDARIPKEILEEIIENLNVHCPICLQELYQPSKTKNFIICPYSTNSVGKYTHGLCLECTKLLLSNTSDTLIKCPICRKNMYSSLPDDTTVTQKILPYLVVGPIIFIPIALVGYNVGPPSSITSEIVREYLSSKLFLKLTIYSLFTGFILGNSCCEKVLSIFDKVKTFGLKLVKKIGNALNITFSPKNRVITEYFDVIQTFGASTLKLGCGAIAALGASTVLPTIILNVIASPRSSPKQLLLDVTCESSLVIATSLMISHFQKKEVNSSRRLQLQQHTHYMGIAARILAPTIGYFILSKFFKKHVEPIPILPRWFQSK